MRKKHIGCAENITSCWKKWARNNEGKRNSVTKRGGNEEKRDKEIKTENM
jgi:hypothetical protein